MEIIKQASLNGFEHIYALNGYTVSSDHTGYYKYMLLDRLEKNVSAGKLVFVSPDLWQDPFEKLYHNIDCSNRGFTPTPEIACMCITDKSSANEEAMWKAYGDQENRKVVRVTYDVNCLYSILNDYSRKHDCKVYIGRAIYTFSKDEITSFYKNTEFCPMTMDIEHYLSLMLLKRTAFSYENEIRIFIVKNEKSNDFLTEGILSVPVDYKEEKLITRVMLAPYLPIDYKKFDAKLIKQRNKLEEEIYKKLLKELLDCSVEQSRLYEPKQKKKQML